MRVRIRDLSNPGSGIYIPDPQHATLLLQFTFFLFYYTYFCIDNVYITADCIPQLVPVILFLFKSINHVLLIVQACGGNVKDHSWTHVSQPG
jgi:hypothetical protein